MTDAVDVSCVQLTRDLFAIAKFLYSTPILLQINGALGSYNFSIRNSLKACSKHAV